MSVRGCEGVVTRLDFGISQDKQSAAPTGLVGPEATHDDPAIIIDATPEEALQASIAWALRAWGSRVSNSTAASA